VTGHTNFDGAGGRLGLDGFYSLRWGFYVYGRGVVDVLGGHFGSTYLQTNTFAGTQASTGVGDDRVVPILEFEGGLGWACWGGHLRLQAGYLANAWFNTLTMPSLIQGVQNGGGGSNTNFTTNGNNFRDTLTFDGLAVRLVLLY